MATSSNFRCFRDPAFSLWQSAIHATLLRQATQGRLSLIEGNRSLGVTADHPFMVASTEAIRELQNPTPAATVRFAGPVGTILECAKLAAEIAWDELFDRAKVPALKNELARSTCDPFWAECLLVYEAFLKSGQKQPYLAYTDINQYVISGCFPDTTEIAVIGDWGTGMNDALVLLQQIATNFSPSVLIHLGDIYYAGLPSEDSDNFTALISEVWPKNPPLVFTLDGNHDRYAGAAGGYYPTIANLNKSAGIPQPNSYFALRNNFWQFVAMDTGYHDIDPYTVTSNVTYLEPSEIKWHLDKIKGNGVGVDMSANPTGVRGTVVLSHHQLMSFTGVGKDTNGHQLAVNPNLAGPFASVLSLIDLWLWGHEHDLCIFGPYSMGPAQQLPAGRCVGASAVPVFPPEPTPPSDLVIPPSESGPPQIVAGTALSDNGNVFNHAYAVMRLNKAALSVSYYQVDSTDATPGNPPPLTPVPFTDNLTAPRVAKSVLGGTNVRP